MSNQIYSSSDYPNQISSLGFVPANGGIIATAGTDVSVPAALTLFNFVGLAIVDPYGSFSYNAGLFTCVKPGIYKFIFEVTIHNPGGSGNSTYIALLGPSTVVNDSYFNDTRNVLALATVGYYSPNLFYEGYFEVGQQIGLYHRSESTICNVLRDGLLFPLPSVTYYSSGF